MSKLNKKSRDSIRPKYSVSPKIGIGRKKQAKKKYDSLYKVNPKAAEKFRKQKNSPNKKGDYTMYISPKKSKK